MSEASELQSCILHQSATQPAIDRLSRDTNAAHSMLREHGTVIERMLLWRDESNRRMSILEQALEVQRNEARRTDQTIIGLRGDLSQLSERVDSEFSVLRDRIGGVGANVNTLIGRLDAHLGEMREAQHQAIDRHGRLMRRIMTVSASLGGLLGVLLALHGAVSGVPIVETMRAWMGMLP